MTVSRESILAARAARKPTRLEVPEWEGPVYVRVLSAADQVKLSDDGDRATVYARVLIAALVNEDGERIFTDEDVSFLMDEEGPVLIRVFAEVAKLNGLSSNELEEAVAVFNRAQDGDSSTG